MKFIDEMHALELYDDMLDEIYGTVNVGVEIPASQVLKECDPIAYRCGLNDWLDSEDLTTDAGEIEVDDEDENDEEDLDGAFTG